MDTKFEMARRASSSKRFALPFGFLALALLANPPSKAQAPLSDEQIGEIAQQGVVYGLPLLLMDLTRQAGPMPSSRDPIGRP